MTRRSTCIVSSGYDPSQAGPWIHRLPAYRRCSLAWRYAFSPIRGAGAASCILCLAICLSATGCRRTAPAEQDPQRVLGDGPEQYSALVVRTIEQGGSKDVVESRITVFGQMTREDWTEHGEKRALIVRPDLGESYLLFLDKSEFVVQRLDAGARLSSAGSASPQQSDAGSDLQRGDRSEATLDPIRIENDLSLSAPPEGVSNIALPNATIDNHPCKAFERRAIIPGGTTEITRTYKATDLSGMTIRTESESDGNGGQLRVITERRDIQIGVSPALFDIPAGFSRKAS